MLTLTYMGAIMVNFSPKKSKFLSLRFHFVYFAVDKFINANQKLWPEPKITSNYSF